MAEEKKSPGKVVVRAADRAVAARWPAAVERAAKSPGATLDDQVRFAQRAFTRELTVVGAAAGATAAAPGVGTFVGVAVATGELALATTRSADLILTVGAIHGLTDASIEERRAWVLSVLLFGETASKGFTKLAGELGKGLGKKATAAIPTATLQSINRTLGRTIVTKYGTKRGAIALGRVLPFGIGAVIGGGANWTLTRALGRHAHSFFSDLPESLRNHPNLAASEAGPHSASSIIEAKLVPSSTGPAMAADRPPRPRVSRSFSDPTEIDRREFFVDAPHVAELNEWVRGLRRRDSDAIVPWFDPMDGGSEASILWLLEAPGPKATRERGGSGFISIDNNDRTAEITSETMIAAGVDRRRAVLWNAVPHYLGDRRRIAAHTDDDLDDAGPLLADLLAMLPDVRAVILGGQAAQKLWRTHAPESGAGLVVIECPHPSPQNINTRPEARGKIVQAWAKAGRA